MKALTIHQPYATALATGMKMYETRPRRTYYRGPFAIHAGKTFNEAGYEVVKHLPFNEHITLPLSRRWSTLGSTDFITGAILAVAELTDCLTMDETLIASISDQERSLGHWEPGRYAYKLENVRILSTPLFLSGKQGMWKVSEEDQIKINEQL